MKRILGLDLGTKCGWCLHCNGRVVAAGTWNLAVKRDESAGMRLVRFRQKLVELNGQMDVMAYEDVKRHRGTHAAHVYGALLGQMQLFGEDYGVGFFGVDVGRIKQFATNKGNASKEAMVAAAAAKWPDFAGDDNEADARWLAELAAVELQE